jgi:hypothetical protein
MLDAVVEGCKTILYWFINLFFEIINPIVEIMFDNFPSLTKSFGTGATYMAHANFYIPLDYGIGLLAALITIQATFISIKLIIKIFIPTFG